MTLWICPTITDTAGHKFVNKRSACQGWNVEKTPETDIERWYYLCPTV